MCVKNHHLPGPRFNKFPDVTIKTVNKLDAVQTKKLHLLYQEEWFSEGRTLNDIELMLKHTDFVFGFCDTASNELLGFARVISDSVYKAFVFDVIVDKEYRSKGLGRFIMDTIIEHPVLKNVSHIELYCPEDMVSFYEPMGFKTRKSLLLRRERAPG